MAVAIDLDAAVIVVTGAAGGLGRALCARLADAGATVVAVVHRAPTADLDGAASTVVADLVAADAPDRVVEAALGAHGRVDGLVNNAAVQPVVPFADLTAAEWRHLMDVDLDAVHRLTHRVAAVMAGQDGGGAVVHVASIEGHRPAPGHTHYAVAKAAVVMHARAAAVELGELGIRVNSVSPGLLDRPGLADDWPEGVARWTAAAPLKRLGRGVDVADAVAFLLSPLAGWITGTDVVIDGGVSARPGW